MRKFVLLLMLLCPLALQAAPNITVSGNSVSILGSAQTISLTCTLIDPSNTGNLRSGSNIITVFVTNTATPGSVATCGPIYGNDVITDGFGNANTTFYKVQVFTVSGGIIASTPALQQFYAFTGSGTVDLSTATPLAPSFMSGANGSVVVPGSLTVSGTLAGNGTNTLANLDLTLYVGGSTPQYGASADIRAQLAVAASLVSSFGGKIILLPQTGGGCYQSSVPLVLNTSGKYVPIEGIFLGNQTGAVKQGSCINDTNTGTITTTAASVASNVATFTFSSNPTTFGILVGEGINVAGFTGGDTYFNAIWSVQTVTSTQVTASYGGFTHANASATSNGTAAHAIATLDYTPTQGGGFTPNTILKNIIFTAGGCVNTVGGCGNSENGIVFGPNAGVHSGKLENVAVYGALNCYIVPNGQSGNVGWSLTFDNSWASSCGTGLALVNNATSETTRWRGGGFSNNGLGVSCTSPITTDLTFDGAVSFDVNNKAMDNNGCRITLNPHDENSGFAGAGLPYITQSVGTITMIGGRMMQDSSVGGPDASMITITGGSINMFGTEVNSGRTITNLINNNGGGQAHVVYYTESPTLVAPDVAGVSQTCSIAYQCQVTKIAGTGSPTVLETVIPVIRIPGAGAGSPDGTASMGKITFNASLNRTQLLDNGATHDNVNGTQNILTASSTDTLTNKKLNTPLTSGTGLQMFNTATSCTTAATINTPCTTAAITLPVAYADTNYRIGCSGLTRTNFPQIIDYAKSNTTFTITLNNLTAAAATYASFDCWAVHN